MSEKKPAQILFETNVKRGRVDHQHMLKCIDSVSVHSTYYKKYGNQRLLSFASRRSESASTESKPKDQLQVIPTFDFKKSMLFRIICGEVFCDESAKEQKKLFGVRKIDGKNVIQYLA